jgi:hypothetical protein
MATPDMTHASGAQDQTEARESGVRGWFQPLIQPREADAEGSGTDFHAVPGRTGERGEAAGQQSGTEVGEDEADDTSGEIADDQAEAASPGDDADDLAERDGPPAGDIGGQGTAEASDTQVGHPEETAVFPRLRVSETLAAASEPVAPDHASGAVSAERSGDDELPTAIQAPLAESGAPKVPPGDRPADITRPQLILDDTVVDMAGLRGTWSSRQTADGSGAADPPPADDTPPADGDAADTGGPRAGKAAKRSRSVFGPEPASRPDMLTNADTVVMASLKGPKGSLAESSAKADEAAAKERNAAAVKQQAITAMVPAGTSVAFTEAATQILPTAEPSQHKPDIYPASSGKAHAKRRGPPAEPAERYTPGRRTTIISRLLLLAILSLQAVLSIRLRNTAFEDESLYLYAGHMELQHLLHGAALYGGFSSYFSGAPVLYPVVAAALDQLGGLTAARALSLFEMLATTALLYSLTRRLFNERIALCAAALFSVSEAVIFLGNFATFDATCLFLLACASWIVVRTAAFRWPVFLLAAPLAALAVGVKYAGLLFVPTIALMPALAGWPERGRRVLLYPLGFGVAVAGLLYAAVRLGGPAYMSAIKSTTTDRAQGTVPVGTILREAAEWGGVLFAAAVIGSVAYVWRVRTEPDEKIAPPGDRLRRIALGVVLTGTALLAPAYQAHLHTDISFLKHVGFGLFFAAPMAGFGLARIMGDYFRRPQFGIGVWSLALVLGMVQSNFLYHVWPPSSAFVTTFSKYLKPNALYLVEVPEVPIYYLEGRPDAQPKQFTSTFPVPPLTTTKDFAAVVKTGEFQVIAYTGVVTPATDQALGRALTASRSYYLADKIRTTDSSGPVTYYIWVKGHKSATGSKGKSKTKKS